MIMAFTSEELTMLLQDGFKPGYMFDIQVGDLVALPPVSREPIYGDARDGDRHKVQTFCVDRIEKNEEFGVMGFIGYDLFNLPRHCSYGNHYPCMIKRTVD